MSTVTIPRADIPIAGSAPPSRDWYRWAHDITQRVGGVTGASTTELELSAFEDAGIEETKASVATFADAAAQTPPNVSLPSEEDKSADIASMRAEIAVLMSRLDAMESLPDASAGFIDELIDSGDSALHFHASDRSRANHAGTQTMSTISDLPTLASGTYTPTLTNTANLDASTPYACQYLRVGSVVAVSGRIDADPTTPGTLTTIGISLPVASNFANPNELGGTGATADNLTEVSAGIFADTANDRATMQWRTTDITNHTMFFTLIYRVI